MRVVDKVFFILFLLLILLSQFSFFDVIRLYGFSVPAGFLVVSPLSGGVFSFTGDAAVIRSPGLEILMPASCSGMTFYFILSLLFCSFGRWKWLWVCYPAAILLNGIRVLLVSFWIVNFSSKIPVSEGIQHQTIGLIFFLFFLLLTALLLNNGSPEEKA